MDTINHMILDMIMCCFLAVLCFLRSRFKRHYDCSKLSRGEFLIYSVITIFGIWLNELVLLQIDSLFKVLVYGAAGLNAYYIVDTIKIGFYMDYDVSIVAWRNSFSILFLLMLIIQILSVHLLTM